ncbi:microtubule-associated protein futsch-like [Hibiscus syriacus]|uniref:microtubule-associated protein futsch-like n=1 Tax=Hibiscus syriacus TaxID=106335 RepID=UPI0019216127|nr:microtubule-associated protein futsch-like [Hibiscus syriacus]
MDFQCLTRKELQFLCKRNKIPANITNVAMVDALNALELVEGFEELQNQSQSPEKTVNKEILGTVTRTSTRRKPCKDEHQSTQSTIRTRKTSRKTMDVEEKNKSLNVPEVEVKDQRKSDIVETPLTSGRSKVNAQKGSFQPAYGTRRSVRLLGKSMAGLSIKESEKMPAKVDEMVEGEDGSKNCQSELPLARNLSASLEDERELKDDVEENSKCVNVETDETGEKLIHEDGSYRESNEKTELEGEDKTADDPLGIIDPKGSDDNAVSEDSINLNEELVADKADDVAVSNDACEIENLNEKPAADETREAYEEPVVDETKSIANVEDVPEEVSDHSSSADTEAMHDDVTILPEAEEHADGHGDVSQNVSVLLAEGHMDSSEEKGNEESNDDDAFLGDSDFNNDTGSESKSLAEEQITALSVPDLPAEVHMESSAKKGNEESNDDDDAFLGDSNIDDDTGSDSKSSAEDSMTKMVDANVTEAETTLVSSFHSGSQSIVDDIAQKMVECGGSEALINVCVKPAEDLADKTPVSNSETITTSMPLSSPSKAQFLQLSKSSNKEQTTVGKVTQESDNLKKENIVEKELAKHKLESLSLRQLKKLNKMFDKLEISHKQPCGKSSRPALQMLPQNSMKSEDGEKQN